MDYFTLEVKSVEGTVYSGQVKSITSINETGTFDILPEHSNAIFLMGGSLTIRPRDGEDRDIKVPQTALLLVRGDKTEIFLD